MKKGKDSSTGPEKTGPEKPKQSARSVMPKLVEGKAVREKRHPASKPASAKRSPTRARKVSIDDLGYLPSAYGSNTLFLIARDPEWLFSYWDVEWSAWPAAAMLGGRFKVYLKLFARDEELSATEIAHDAPNWYLRAPRPDTEYRAQIGCYGADGKWRAIAESNVARTPSDSVSLEDRASFATLPTQVTMHRLFEMVKDARLEGETPLEALARLQEQGRKLAFALGRIADWSDEERKVLAELFLHGLDSGALGSERFAEGLSSMLSERLSSVASSEIHAALVAAGASEETAASWLAALSETLASGASSALLAGLKETLSSQLFSGLSALLGQALSSRVSSGVGGVGGETLSSGASSAWMAALRETLSSRLSSESLAALRETLSSGMGSELLARSAGWASSGGAWSGWSGAGSSELSSEMQARWAETLTSGLFSALASAFRESLSSASASGWMAFFKESISSGASSTFVAAWIGETVSSGIFSRSAFRASASETLSSGWFRPESGSLSSASAAIAAWGTGGAWSGIFSREFSGWSMASGPSSWWEGGASSWAAEFSGSVFSPGSSWGSASRPSGVGAIGTAGARSWVADVGLSGSVEPGSRLMIGGRNVAVAADGQFFFRARLAGDFRELPVHATGPDGSTKVLGVLKFEAVQ